MTINKQTIIAVFLSILIIGFFAAQIDKKIVRAGYGSILISSTSTQNILIPSTEKGLTAYFPLNRESLTAGTSTLADFSSNSYRGTINYGTSAGFTTDQRGAANQALLFDGANTTIPTTLTATSSFQNGFTISAWIKPDSAGEGNAGRIVDKSSGDNSN